MVEEKINRPAGGREGDFGELSDWTITGIATAAETSPEDRKNAEAEIARREKAGNYNPDDSPQDIRSDLLSHGYGMDNGKFLYPKPEYESWLKSDRSTQIPRGIVRESIEDRLVAERQEARKARGEAGLERRREFDKATGEAAIAAFGDAPTRVKIHHPPMAPTSKNIITRERNFVPESAETRAKKLYNYYEANFGKLAPRWVSFGVSSLLEKGIVNPPTNMLLRSGFWSREKNRVHDRIDPEDSISTEAIDAEANLKLHVSQDLIDAGTEAISEDSLRSAKRDGLLYAIYSGVRIDGRSRKIIYSIPSERGGEVVEFMKQNGVNPDSEKVQLMSQNGFIGVLDAIKDDKKATKKGFETLDWYFDTFGYEKHLNELVENVNEYGEESDQAFMDKFDEYLAHRKELMEWKEQKPRQEDEAIAALADSEKITYGELMLYLQENLSEKGEVEVFPLPDMFDRDNEHSHNERNSHPSSVEKCTKAKTEIERIREIDPNADYLVGSVFENSSEGKRIKKQDYVLVRFGNNNFNNVVAIHIGGDSRAVFAWRGKTGDDADAWKDIWRSSIRGRSPDIKRFICRGYSKRGPLALDDEWSRIWSYFNSPEKETV